MSIVQRKHQTISYIFPVLTAVRCPSKSLFDQIVRVRTRVRVRNRVNPLTAGAVHIRFFTFYIDTLHISF